MPEDQKAAPAPETEPVAQPAAPAPAPDHYDEALKLRHQAISALQSVADAIPDVSGDRFIGGLRSDLNHCVALLSLRA